jgi:hypothetical protein
MERENAPPRPRWEHLFETATAPEGEVTTLVLRSHGLEDE